MEWHAPLRCTLQALWTLFDGLLGRGINNQQSIGNLCNAMAAQIRTPTTDDKNLCSQEKLLFRVQKDHLFEEKSPLEILTVHRHSEKMLSTLGTHLVMH